MGETPKIQFQAPSDESRRLGLHQILPDPRIVRRMKRDSGTVSPGSEEPEPVEAELETADARPRITLPSIDDGIDGTFEFPAPHDEEGDDDTEIGPIRVHIPPDRR